MADEKAASTTDRGLKLATSVVDLIKSLVVLAVLVYLLLSAGPAIKKVLNNIETDKQSVTDVKVDGKSVELKLTEVQQNLKVIAKDTIPTNGKADQPVSGAGKNVLAALNTTNDLLASVTEASSKLPALPNSAPAEPANASAPSAGGTERWVYLGEQFPTGWRPNNFALKGMPTIGSTIKAVTDVYKRDARPVAAPTPSDPTNWNIGKPVGLVHQGASILVADVLKIVSDDGGLDWWAKVS